jgi:hypothetical protein
MLWPLIPGWELNVEPFSLDLQHLAVSENRCTKIREKKEELLRIAERLSDPKLSPGLRKFQNAAFAAGSPIDRHELPNSWRCEIYARRVLHFH